MKIRNIVLPIMLLIACSGATLRAQQVIESPALSPFTAISLIGPLRVELIRSDTARVNLTLWDINKHDIEWRVKDGTLELIARRGMINKMAHVDVKLYYSDLNKISNAGAEILCTEPVVSSSLHIEALSSEGIINLSVKCAEINVAASGKNRITLEGSADFVALRAKLGSTVECYSLTAETMQATASEWSAIELRATKRLNVKATTGGEIRYITDPETVITSKRNTAGKLTSIAAM